jgi:hypothetical protein
MASIEISDSAISRTRKSPLKPKSLSCHHTSYRKLSPLTKTTNKTQCANYTIPDKFFVEHVITANAASDSLTGRESIPRLLLHVKPTTRREHLHDTLLSRTSEHLTMSTPTTHSPTAEAELSKALVLNPRSRQCTQPQRRSNESKLKFIGK